MTSLQKQPVALVTGASRGIGREIALALADSGFSVAGLARTKTGNGGKKGLDDLQPLIEAKGVSFLSIEGDIGDINAHPSTVGRVIDTFGRLDLLVNNAGQAPEKRTDILETTASSFDQVLKINLKGTFFLTQTVVNRMVKLSGQIQSYHPKVIFITSISADVSSTNRIEYCIAKAGLSMAAKGFADKFAGKGINVYEIRPGIIQTDMTSAVSEQYDKLIKSGLIPQNRWGKPADVAKVVASIARGDFDYATGMIVEISGGMNLRRL